MYDEGRTNRCPTLCRSTLLSTASARPLWREAPDVRLVVAEMIEAALVSGPHIDQVLLE